MAVAEDHRGEGGPAGALGRRGRPVAGLRRNVAHEDASAPQLQFRAKRQDLGPGLVVAVAPDRGDRGERAQLREHLRRTHVPGVDDVGHALEKLLHLRVEVAVGVGENADADEFSRQRGRRPGRWPTAAAPLLRVPRQQLTLALCVERVQFHLEEGGRSTGRVVGSCRQAGAQILDPPNEDHPSAPVDEAEYAGGPRHGGYVVPGESPARLGR